MKPSLFRELTLYRYRYAVGYGLFIVFLLGMLLTDIGSVPSGISDSEMSSSVASNALNPFIPHASDVISLPYHLLQKLSISLLGLSPFSIRLPSLVLALAASGILAAMLALWFRRGVAILALLLATTSVAFISFGRTGTAAVLYMLLLLIVLLGAVKLTTKSPYALWWKFVVTTAGLLLIYMPLGVYAVIAFIIAGLFHPHVRYQIKHTKWWQSLLFALLSVILLAPLIIAAINDRQTLEVLFGIDQLFSKLSLEAIGASILAILKSFFLFNKTVVGETISPFLSLPLALLVAFGLVRTITDFHAARSYLLHVWILISIPLLILNPTQLALLFVPCVMLTAIGLETFLHEWYKLFPRNPYARVFALVPISLVIVGVVAVSASRYFDSYNYTDTSRIYHPELTAVRKAIRPITSTQLVVPEGQVAFYDMLRKQNSHLTVVSPKNAVGNPADRIVLGSVNFKETRQPSAIYTSHMASNPVLLRVYGNARY